MVVAVNGVVGLVALVVKVVMDIKLTVIGKRMYTKRARDQGPVGTETATRLWYWHDATLRLL